MAWWQGLQTMRVFLRIRVMSCAHLGCGCPVLVRSASLRTWWISTSVRVSHHSHRRVRSLWMSSLRRVGRPGRRSVRTAFFCRFSGIPPNLVTSGFLPSRSTVAWKQTRGPCGVVMVALYLRPSPSRSRTLAAAHIGPERASQRQPDRRTVYGPPPLIKSAAPFARRCRFGRALAGARITERTRVDKRKARRRGQGNLRYWAAAWPATSSAPAHRRGPLPPRGQPRPVCWQSPPSRAPNEVFSATFR